VYRLASDCARDTVVRKFVAPALELIMLDKALRGEYSREEALLIFGEMYATAVAGDGTVRSKRVELVVGGELGGGAALLRLATLHLLKELLPKELKFGARAYVGEGSLYNITATSENAVKFKRFLAVTAPSAGGEYLSDKFDEFVEEAKVEVRVDNIRQTERRVDNIGQTEGGLVAADLTISVGGVAVKYNIYLRNEIELRFASTDRSRAELAACLLRLAGVSAGVSKLGDRDEWHVIATTDMLAAGRKELRDVLAEFVKTARDNGGVDADKAERWLKKLKRGLNLKKGWPRYKVRLVEGALVVIFGSTSPDSIKQEAQRLEKMGLKRGVHFSVKMPEGGKAGYVSVLKEGLAYAAWLSVHGKDEDQRELAADFVKIILQRARDACGGMEPCAVYEKAEEIVEEGKERGSLTLKGFVKEVEVDGKKYVVKVMDGEAVEEDRGGRKLLRIRITAEVDGVRREYVITYGRYGRDNAALGFATARADAPGGREKDAERFSALIKALTGREPKVYRRSDGVVMIECYEGHLEGFTRYKELAEAIKRWMEKTKRR